MEEEDVSNESNPSMGPVDELGEFASGSSDAEAGAEEYAPVASGAGDDASDALDATIGGVEFPVDAFARVAEGLNRHASWTVYPASLAECLTAAIEITSTGDIAAERRCAPAAASPPRPSPPPATRARDRRARSRARERGGAPRRIFFLFPGRSFRIAAVSRTTRTPPPSLTARRPPRIHRALVRFRASPYSSKELRQLYRELVPNTFEKCITYEDLTGWAAHIHDDILRAASKLAELVALKLSPGALSAYAAADDDPEALKRNVDDAEEDVISLVRALAMVFDEDSRFHEKHLREPLPAFARRANAAGGECGDELARGVAERFADPEYEAVHAIAGYGAYPARDDGVIDITADSDDERDVTAAPGGDDTPEAVSARDAAAYGGRGESAGGEKREVRRWLRFLVDHFGDVGGFDSLLALLRAPEATSPRVLDAAMRLAARCANRLERGVLDQFETALSGACAHLADAARDGDDPFLGGCKNASERDRNYVHASGALRRARKALAACVGAGEAERRVSSANRAVIEGMLAVSTFNMQLVALREIDAMLAQTRRGRGRGKGGEKARRGAERRKSDAGAGLDGCSAEDVEGAVRTAVEWLEEKRVMAHVLRPVYLHHRQYVDQATSVLRHLAQEGAMRDEHIDLLWDVSQRPDTFEEVKNNVLDLLATLAWHFSGEQLDGLFGRVERAGALKNDCAKILEMVQKLARTDAAGVMAERLLELLWRMLHAGRHERSDDETTAAFARVLGHYARAGSPCARPDDWARRALANVRERDADLAVSLRLFRAVATLDGVGAGDPSAVPEEGIAPEEVPGSPSSRLAAKRRRRACAEPFAASGAPRRADRVREFVRAFDERDGLAETLVASAERFQAEAWAEAREKEREKGSSGRARKKSGAKDVPLARRDPPAYARTLGALMDVILFAHKRGELEVSPETARRLWSAFVETPPGAARAPTEPSASDRAAGGGGLGAAADGRAGGGGASYRDLGLTWMTKLLVASPSAAPRECVSAMLTEKLVREPAAEMTPRGWRLFKALFLQAAADAGRVVVETAGADVDDARDPWAGLPSGEERDVTSEAPPEPRTLVPESVPLGSLFAAGEAECEGAEQLWRVATDAPEASEAASRDEVLSETDLGGGFGGFARARRGDASDAPLVAGQAIDLLIQLSVEARPGDRARANGGARREAFLAKILARARDAARESREGGEAAQTLARRRAGRCLILAKRTIAACERIDASGDWEEEAGEAPGARSDVSARATPHGSSFRGAPVRLEIVPVAQREDAARGAFVIHTHANATVRSVKKGVARELNAPVEAADAVRLIVAGRDVGSCDDDSLRECLPMRHLAVGNAIRVQCLFHRAARNRARAFDASDASRNPRTLLAKQTGAYDVLFELAETGDDRARRLARELLRALPTRREVKENLRECLSAESNGGDDLARSRLREAMAASPARLVYALQTLDGMLRGTHDASTAPVAETAVADAETSAARARFVAIGCAGDMLSVLPAGCAQDASGDAAARDGDGKEDPVAAAAKAAWRDPALRRQLCASALSLLRILLEPAGDAGASDGGADAAFDDDEDDNDATDASVGSLGLAAVALASPESRVVGGDGGGGAAFAAEAAPALAAAAHAVGAGDAGSAGECGTDADFEHDADDDSTFVTREDARLAARFLRLLFASLRAEAPEARAPSSPTRRLLRLPLFPAMLDDLLIAAPTPRLRRAFAREMLRGLSQDPSSANGECESAEAESDADALAAALLDRRAFAERNPTRCREYFDALCRLLRRGGDAAPKSRSATKKKSGSQSMDEAALSSLLASEIEALRAAPPTTDPGADAHLRGRLELIECLVRRLDRRSVGSRGAGLGLVQVLLYRCLFPEAVPLLRPPADVLRLANMPPAGPAPGRAPPSEASRRAAKEKEKHPPPSDDSSDATVGAGALEPGTLDDGNGETGAIDDDDLEGSARCWPVLDDDAEVSEAHLQAACGTPATRRAAFSLLADLAAHDAENMLEVTETLANLHHRGSSRGAGDFFGATSEPSLVGGAPRQPGGYVGLKNAGATCYMNSIFQQLWMQPSLRDDVLRAPPLASTEKERRESVFYQFQLMFASLAFGRADHYVPRGFWRAFKDYDGEPINVREHQDGLEFFGRLQDQVDAEFKKAVARRAKEENGDESEEGATSVEAEADAKAPRIEGAMERAMGGKFVNQVISRSCPHRSEREEDFVHVSVEVQNKRDLVESLSSYVSGELLEADNQWSCEQCGCKRDAVKRACFRGEKLPNTLCVHLKRFEFDYQTMLRMKIKSRFEFPMELDMTPYTVEALEREANARRGDGGDAEPLPARRYALVGVVVHSGTAFAGHYYSYIRERTGARRWHVFDDQRVEPYDVSSIEQDTFGGKYTVNLARASGAAEDDDVIGGGAPAENAVSAKEFDRPNSAYMLFYERVRENPDPTVPGDGVCSRSNDAARSMTRVPRPIRRAVMSENLRRVFDGNLHSREYFDFVRALVEAARDGGRRRAEGSRRKALKAHTRDFPGSDTSRNGESSRDASRANPGGDGEALAGGADADERAILSVRVAVEFLTRVYARASVLPAPSFSLDDERADARGPSAEDADALAWRGVVGSVLDASPAARRWFLEYFRDRPNDLVACLADAPVPETRRLFAELVGIATTRCVTRDGGGDAAEQAFERAFRRAEDDEEGPPGAGAARQPRDAALLVESVLRVVVRGLHDALARLGSRGAEEPGGSKAPSFASLAGFFRVLEQYAKLGPAHRYRLLQYDVAERCAEYCAAAYRAPARAGAVLGARETRAASNLLSALLRTCDLGEARRWFAASGARRALAIIADGGAAGPRTTASWVVGDLVAEDALIAAEAEYAAEAERARGGSNDEAEDGGGGGDDGAPNAPGGRRVSKNAPPGLSPFALDGGRVPCPPALRAMLPDPDLVGALVELASMDGAVGEAAMVALEHACWRWEAMSKMVADAVLDDVDAEGPTGLPGVLRVAERLLDVEDWCAEIRAGYLLEGKTFDHPHARGTALSLPPHLVASRPPGEDGKERTGIIEQAAYENFGYPKRYRVLRWLIKTLQKTFPSVRAQDEDFEYVVKVTAQEYDEQGPPRLSPEEEHGEEEEEEEEDGSERKSAKNRANAVEMKLNDPEWVVQKAWELLGHVAQDRNKKR